IIVAAVVSNRAAQIENAVANHPEVRVVPGRNIERDQAIVNSIEIHLDRDRLPAAGLLVLVVLLCVVARLLIGLGFVFILVLVAVLGFILVVGLVLILLLADFIAPRAERIL